MSRSLRAAKPLPGKLFRPQSSNQLKALEERAVTTSRRRLMFSCIYICILTATTLVLTEVALRLLPAVLPEPQRSVLEEARRITLCNTRMYYGTRILLPAISKADAIVVGDSFPFGTDVRAEDAFPARLERLSALKIVNLGVASASPVEYNQVLEAGMRYRPERVLYCVFANDFLYTQPISPRRLGGANDSGNPAGSPLFLEAAGFGDRLHILRKRAMNPLISFQLFKLQSQELQRVQHVPFSFGGAFFMFVPREYWDPYLLWDLPEVRAGLETNARLVQEANRFTREHGAILTVVLLPSKEMVYGPLVPVGSRIYSDGHHRTYRELAEHLQEARIPWVDLTAPLRDVASKGQKLYFTIDGHLNEAGHDAVARLLNERIRLAP